MKNKILILAVTAFMAGAIFSSCQSSAKKVENAENKLQDAQNNVTDARNDLNKAKSDSVTEYQKFKQASEEKINAHEKSIAEFKVTIAREKPENRARYERKMADLELQNREMRKK
jgi:DNA anti-recombination protein RmuC